MATLYVGSARRDENGRYVNGSAGDQDGKEVSTQAYYMHSKGWRVLRAKSVEHADLIAKYMLRACNNQNIGYDQYNRLGVIKYGTSSKYKTECDCSSLVRQVVKEATGKDPGNFTTANEVKMLEATGLFEDAFDVKSSTLLYNGDILVTKTKGHTVVVTSGRERKSATKTTQKVSDTKMPTIRYGSEGKAVKVWQIIVGVTADGDFGNITLNATKKFQQKYDLEVDGIVGTNTWKKGLESV